MWTLAGACLRTTTTGGFGGADNCTFTIQSTLNSIATVATVQWFVVEGTPTEAHIDFRPDTSYGTAAPVDPNEAGYRTYLLGMKPDSRYHYHVVATVKERTPNPAVAKAVPPM